MSAFFFAISFGYIEHQKNNNMKHLKHFNSASSVNEAKMTRAQIKNAMIIGDESIEAISAIKEDLLNNGIITNDKTEPIDQQMKHLPSCQSIMYKSVPLPPPLKINNC